MKCIKCGGETYFCHTLDTIETGEGVFAIRNIPCHRCIKCDEIMYTGVVVADIEKSTKEFKRMISE